jgi:hypothetical protein
MLEGEKPADMNLAAAKALGLPAPPSWLTRADVNTGCTPTKTLAASAYVAHVARRAADYGVMIGGTSMST